MYPRNKRFFHVSLAVKQKQTSTKLYAYKGNIQILPIAVFASYDDIKVMTICWNHLLCDSCDQLAQGLGETLLVSGENVIVKQALAA
jgi:hypothetical protein